MAEHKGIPLILAPMAGYTDHAFRRLCRAFGADYTVTEMISAKALHYGDEKTAVLACLTSDEAPAAVQLFGSEPDIMAEAAALIGCGGYRGCVSDCAPVAIDVNMGCPMKKIVSNGEGSALMRSPDKIHAIVRAMVSAVSLPITVKLRTGWDSAHINAVECALAAKEGGASAITVHGRTKEQLYAPGIDLDTIAAVKRAIGDTFLIGNGGIETADDARAMLKATGCDALMIGQGAIGRPWIFSEIKAAMEDREYSAIASIAEVMAVAKKHLLLIAADKGEYAAVHEGRHHLARYVKGIRGGARFRDEINHTETLGELCDALERIASMN